MRTGKRILKKGKEAYDIEAYPRKSPMPSMLHHESSD